MISTDKVLVHYNPDLPLILATDASPIDLGTVLSHRYNDGTQRPITLFASRALTRCEQNYSQIDKEEKGIYWGMKNFFSTCANASLHRSLTIHHEQLFLILTKCYIP